MLIPVVIEPDYRDTIWCNQVVKGMKSEAAGKKYDLKILDGNLFLNALLDLPSSKKYKYVVVLGTAEAWCPKAIMLLVNNGFHVILAGYFFGNDQPMVSHIMMSHSSATQNLLAQILKTGRKKIALYGINTNSSADMLKLKIFRQMGMEHNEKNIYFNNASLDRCFESFKPYIDKYDAVLCANGVAAASLINRLPDADLNRLFLASFDGVSLPRLMYPEILTASLDHEEMGRQAVSAFAYLRRQPEKISINVRIGSPVDSCDALSEEAFFSADKINFYEDSEAAMIISVEEILSHCDALDIEILIGLLSNKNRETLAEELFTSTSTIRYRLQRMAARRSSEEPDIVIYISKYLTVDMLQRLLIASCSKPLIY